MIKLIKKRHIIRVIGLPLFPTFAIPKTSSDQPSSSAAPVVDSKRVSSKRGQRAIAAPFLVICDPLRRCVGQRPSDSRLILATVCSRVLR